MNAAVKARVLVRPESVEMTLSADQGTEIDLLRGLVEWADENPSERALLSVSIHWDEQNGDVWVLRAFFA